MHRPLITGALLALAGCASTPEGDINNDFVTYDQILEVTEHTKNLDACDSDGSDQLGDPYFRLLEDDNGGLEYFTCRTPDDCNESADDWQSFPDAKDNKWDGSVAWVSYAAAENLCTTYIRKSTLKFKDNGNASITRQECNSTFGVEVFSESECEDMMNESLSCTTSTESCLNYEQITAAPVEE